MCWPSIFNSLPSSKCRPRTKHAAKTHQERWNDTADTPGIELDEGKITSVQALEDDRRDQKSRDDEKDIDAYEAAGKPVRECVEADDRQYGQRTETVDIGAVVRMEIALAGCWR
jgi:hypothetical protein